ncbi:biopolymer transporter ExbD [candidate division KSB1 bacterium]|nr:biopolymer transporter ExbD [candidate division KSB1 bacterium]
MAINHFSKELIEREVELPTLIDVVFLLLIFFIASLTFATQGEKKPAPSDQKEEFSLPKAKGRVLQDGSMQLTNLLFQIENKMRADSSYVRVVYVLWPDGVKKMSENELLDIIKQNLEQEQADSTCFATFPPDYLKMSYFEQEQLRAFQLIRDNIRKYHENELAHSASKLANTIEIRATRETEFRIISYIMQQCSEFDDDIPKVTFRVMAPDETETGEG